MKKSLTDIELLKEIVQSRGWWKLTSIPDERYADRSKKAIEAGTMKSSTAMQLLTELGWKNDQTARMGEARPRLAGLS